MGLSTYCSKVLYTCELILSSQQSYRMGGTVILTLQMGNWSTESN